MKAVKSLINTSLLKARNSFAVSILKKITPRKLREAAWSSVSSQDEFSVMGSWMHIPSDSRSRDIVLDQYEPGVSRCLEKLLKPGSSFCDVGANFGIFTLFASRIVGPGGKVFAFEPVEANRAVLERNIKRNGAGNVKVFNKAVSEVVGTARIFLSKDAGCHSLSSIPTNSDGAFVDVDVVRLDKVEEITRIDVLKIDVEGAELEVLSGLGDLPVDYVILEYNSSMITRRGMTGAEFIERLHGFGFENILNLDDENAGLSPIRSGDDTTVNLLVSKLVLK